MTDPSTQTAAHWHADPDVLVTDLGDELVLLHSRTSQMYSLNAVARTAWQALPATTPALLAAVLATYDVPAGQARTDLDALLTDLVRLDMLRQA